MDEKILILAPHCDDEILGCGGAIARYIEEGVAVYVAVVTNGHIGAPELFSEEGTKQVRKEAVEAHQFLGVEETFFLDFPAPKLDSVPSYKLSIEVNKLIKTHQITTLYIPHRGDIHKDHRLTYEAALVAARPVNGCTVRKIYAYETLSETEWAAPFGDDMFIPTMFVDITEHIEKKKRAFQFFETQIKEFPHSRSLKSIEILSNYRGATVGINNAEAFMLVREIR